MERREKTDRSSGISFGLLFLPALPDDLVERREKTDRSSGVVSLWLLFLPPPLPDDLVEKREKTDLAEPREDTERSSHAPPPSTPPSRAALGAADLDLSERREPPTDRLLMYSSSRHLGQCCSRT
jgi:hypothetical protein